MTKLTHQQILELKMSSDIGTVTIREYLIALLLTLWDDGESFSGKRPFGNGGWEYHIYACLVENKVIDGDRDSYGYLLDFDELAGFNLVKKLIKTMCKAPK